VSEVSICGLTLVPLVGRAARLFCYGISMLLLCCCSAVDVLCCRLLTPGRPFPGKFKANEVSCSEAESSSPEASECRRLG
jgi:hypothetical protein